MLAAAPEATQAAIGNAFHAASRELVAAGLACNMLDGAESIVAAIYRYTVESHDIALRAARDYAATARSIEAERAAQDAADLATILS
jgi:hypothetical protein